jgi:hypothetical protein
MQCFGHLKQLSVALHHYHDTHGAFPAGTVVGSAKSPEDRLSWLVSVLPFFESEDLFRQIDQTHAWKAERNQPFTSIPVKYFRCPSRFDGDDPAAPSVTSYLGLAGIGVGSETVPLDDPRAGMFGYERRPRLKDVKDGLGTTLLILEADTLVGPWASGGPATVRPLRAGLQPYLGPGRQFGGIHRIEGRTVTNVVFADGSLRSFQETVEPRVLEALATIAGGEQVPADF